MVFVFNLSVLFNLNQHMKKITSIITLLFICFIANSQQAKITSAQSYLDFYFNKEGDINLEKAKTEIDEAVVNEKSMAMAKAWYYKGIIYQSIYENKEIAKKFETVDLLGDAYAAYVKTLELNDVRFRDQEALFKNLNGVCSYIFNRGIEQFQAKKFAEGYQSFIKLEGANTFFVNNNQKFGVPLGDIRNNAALCAMQAGMTKEAITLYENIIAKGTEDASVYSTLTTLYKKDNRDADARKLLDNAVMKFPNNINLLIAQLNYYLAEDKFAEAIDKINKAIELDPKNDQLYVAAGLAYDKMKDIEKSRAMYLKSTEINDKNLNAWNNLGSTYVDEANSIIKEMNALGNSAADSKRYDELNVKKVSAFTKAKPFIEKALSLDPTNEALKRVMMKINTAIAN
jgi:tetratricopeptide (TPR) repeat protein